MFLISFATILFILLQKFDSAVCHSCTSFKDVVVLFKDKKEEKFNKTIDGCIERISLDNRTVTAAYVRQQNVPILYRDTVRNMAKLNTVSFWGGNTESVEAVAFRNVPRLKNLQISYCDVKKIPVDVFNLIPSLEVIRIHNNKIDTIEDLAFSNLTKLKKIYSSHNKLKNYKSNWFQDSTSLEIMDFQHNEIRTIPSKAFVGFGKLKRIYFDGNDIDEIQERSFEGVTNLEYLGLSHNKLKEIGQNSFPDKLKVGTLLISANYLNYLSDELLKKISVADMVVHLNPWKCPCLDRVYFWLNENHGVLRQDGSCTGGNVPICAFDKVDSRSCSENVDDELTRTYLDQLRNLKDPLSPLCARLD